MPDDRDVTVYLPPGYDEEPDRQYPVLYLQDGQNLFDPRTSFIPGRTWKVADTADAVIASGEVEPLIIVGIANTGEHRLSEYTPTRDWKMGGGEAHKYGDLLAQDLLPFISGTYRVRQGVAEHRPGRIVAGWPGHPLSGAQPSECFWQVGDHVAFRLVEPQIHRRLRQ